MILLRLRKKQYNLCTTKSHSIFTTCSFVWSHDDNRFNIQSMLSGAKQT